MSALHSQPYLHPLSRGSRCEERRATVLRLNSGWIRIRSPPPREFTSSSYRSSENESSQKIYEISLRVRSRGERYAFFRPHAGVRARLWVAVGGTPPLGVSDFETTVPAAFEYRTATCLAVASRRDVPEATDRVPWSRFRRSPSPRTAASHARRTRDVLPGDGRLTLSPSHLAERSFVLDDATTTARRVRVGPPSPWIPPSCGSSTSPPVIFSLRGTSALGMAEEEPPPKDDPVDDEPPYLFECTECGNRTEADERPGACPECGGEMQNLSKPSER